VIKFDFSQCKADAEHRIAQIETQLQWSSEKVKTRLGVDKWQLNRELKEERDWLDWLNANEPATNKVGAEAIQVQHTADTSFAAPTSILP